MSEQATITADVRFLNQSDSYTLYVTPRLKAENLAVQALIQMAPWLLLLLLIFSLLCALVYSRYITAPCPAERDRWENGRFRVWMDL